MARSRRPRPIYVYAAISISSGGIDTALQSGTLRKGNRVGFRRRLSVSGDSAARFGPRRDFCDDSSTLVVGQPGIEPLVPETALPEGVIAERRLAVEAKPLQERR